MHEVGHGLYEHGIDPALARTTLDTGVSLGVHESQSRLWENLVGRSEPFWTPLAAARWRDAMPETLARRRRSTTSCARSTSCAPTLIRVEADELTYSLHVILRFELELALIEGTLDAGRPARGVGGRRCARCSASRCPTTCAASCRTSTGRRGSSATSRPTRSATSSPPSCGARARADLPGLDDDLRAGEYGDAARLARREGPPPRPPADAAGAHRAGRRRPAGPGADARAPRREVPRAVRLWPASRPRRARGAWRSAPSMA